MSIFGGGSRTALSTPLVTGPPIAGYSADWDTNYLPQVNGSTVQYWYDTVGNNFSSTLPTNSPTLYTSGGNTINGHPALLFDGVNDAMLSTLVLGGPPLTIVVIMQVRGAPGAGTYAPIMVDGMGPNDGLYIGTAPQFVTYAGSYQGLDGTLVLSKNYCMSAVFNGATSSYQLNDTYFSSFNSGANSLGLNWSMGHFGSSAWLNAIVGELIMYPFALSVGQCGNMWTYAQNKWGLIP